MFFICRLGGSAGSARANVVNTIGLRLLAQGQALLA